ncbi:hypothetical protein M0R45_008928 [Rubus argutus]|uniref:Uncharacterized protein n=1 Tax=Rubus argutus TaxID=59490 RepID=A0AAW1Y4H8_RUBAR
MLLPHHHRSRRPHVQVVPLIASPTRSAQPRRGAQFGVAALPISSRRLSRDAQPVNVTSIVFCHLSRRSRATIVDPKSEPASASSTRSP